MWLSVDFGKVLLPKSSLEDLYFPYIYMFGLLVDPWHHKKPVNLLLLKVVLKNRSEGFIAKEVLVVFHVYCVFLLIYPRNDRDWVKVPCLEVRGKVGDKRWAKGWQKVFGRILLPFTLNLSLFLYFSPEARVLLIAPSLIRVWIISRLGIIVNDVMLSTIFKIFFFFYRNTLR